MCKKKPFSRFWQPYFGQRLVGPPQQWTTEFVLPSALVGRTGAIQIGPNSTYDTVWLKATSGSWLDKPILLSKHSPVVGQFEPTDIRVVPHRSVRATPLIQVATASSLVQLSYKGSEISPLELIVHDSESVPNIPTVRAPLYESRKVQIPSNPGTYTNILAMPAYGRGLFKCQFSAAAGNPWQVAVYPCFTVDPITEQFIIDPNDLANLAPIQIASGVVPAGGSESIYIDDFAAGVIAVGIDSLGGPEDVVYTAELHDVL